MALTLRTDPELDAALDALTEASQTSKQALLRQLVLEKYEQVNHRAAVRLATEQVIEEWGDVLERLGDA